MKEILVLANDAGGAELLSSLVAEEKDRHGWKVIVPAASPAQSIFEKKGLKGILSPWDPTAIKPENFSRYVENLVFDIVIYNPGWTAFPRVFVKDLHLGERKSVAVLDHWINYRERFGYPERGWQKTLPDFIAVCDGKAYDLASRRGLPSVVRIRNYHLCEQLEMFGRLPKEKAANSGVLLFLSQTVGDALRKKDSKNGFRFIGDLERDVLEDIVENFEGLSSRFGIKKIKIRLHPSETGFKHTDILQADDAVTYELENSRDRDLLESIAGADLVVGMNSMALFTAYVCGKPSLSIIPGESLHCTLPLPPELCVNRISEVLHGASRESIVRKHEIDLFPEIDFANLLMKM